jgi:hypothetical protein
MPSASQASPSVSVTADNFIRAESDTVFTGLVAQGGFCKFFHNRQLTPIDSPPLYIGLRSHCSVGHHP